MNDIAKASERGRRTLYTYFRSKADIYHAVVTSELNNLYKKLQEVADKDMPADEKLIAFVYARLDALQTLVERNGSLQADMFQDVWRVEKIRKDFNIRETEIIRKILQDGIREGIFYMPDIDMTALLLHHALKGVEVPYIRSFMTEAPSRRLKRRENVVHLLFNGLRINNE